MPKLYEDKPRNDELFLRLWQDGGKVELDLVDDMGRWQAVLARIDGNGLHLAAGADPRCAARAGMADALDADGRLKVIGGGGEEEAEPLQWTEYGGSFIEEPRLRVGHIPELGLVRVGLAHLDTEDLVDLHARIGRHIAFLREEGKL